MFDMVKLFFLNVTWFTQFIHFMSVFLKTWVFQKIIVLVCFLCFGYLSIAQRNSLVIFSAEGQPFYLSINKEPINKIAQSNVKAFDLSVGWALIEIKIPSIIKELRFKDSILLGVTKKNINKEFTYVLEEHEGKLSLHFKSVSEFSGPEKPTVPEPPKEVIPLVDNSIYGNLYKAVNNKPVFYNNFNAKNNKCEHDLNDQEIKYALNLMNKANDKEAAYRYLKQIIDSNCYSVNQLKILLETAPIDMDRLNSAKKAYSHVIDKQNITALMPIFKYPVMKESFGTFLKDEENVLAQKRMNCKEPCSESAFTNVYQLIKKAAYENEKVIVAKKELVDVCLSSIQIKKLGELFSHDREKLEFIKYALPVLTDKENAKSLIEEFQYQGTKDDYLKYLAENYETK